jgi:hypothetical protein
MAIGAAREAERRYMEGRSEQQRIVELELQQAQYEASLAERRPGGRHPATVGTTFDFLGFTHVWGHSRNGKNVVRQITAKDRYERR